MNQEELVELSQALISTLSIKLNGEEALMRTAYIHFVIINTKQEIQRWHTSGLQKVLESAITALAIMMSSQTRGKLTTCINLCARQQLSVMSLQPKI